MHQTKVHSARFHAGRRRVHRAAGRMGAAVQGVAAALVARPLTWVVFVGVLWALPLTRAFTRDLPLPPPVLGAVPAFTLTDETGAAFASESLRGRMWVASFSTLDHMADDGWLQTRLKLQHRLRNMGDSARIVTVSADPARDTQPLLGAYAKAHHAKPSQWHFLTGPTAELHTALSGQLRDQQQDLLPGATMHDTGYFLLVDPDLRVRGFYPPSAEGIDRMVVDCGLVANFYRPVPPPEGTVS